MSPRTRVLACWLMLHQVLDTQANLSLHHDWREEEGEEEKGREGGKGRGCVLPEEFDHTIFEHHGKTSTSLFVTNFSYSLNEGFQWTSAEMDYSSFCKAANSSIIT